MKREDFTAILPNSNPFAFWEEEIDYNRELHVDMNHKNASDSNEGSKERPFKTINGAALVATPGSRVIIHGGEYRECVRPVCGGSDAAHMISYEAAEGEKVVIKASEPVTKFIPSTDWRIGGDWTDPREVEGLSVYMVKLDPELYKGYNPFCGVNIIHDRLFIEYGKTDMTPYLNRRGMVFCDGKPLRQVALPNDIAKQGGCYWVESNGQTIHFRLEQDEDPNNHVIELSCREQCFAPEIPFLNFIKVKGLICAHASMGAPVPQRGSISCNRGHHWIIEDCTVEWSNAVGIDVGNECWHHKIKTEQCIGYSVIRGCRLYDCGVCAIAGLFARNMLIEDNIVRGTGWQKMELSWEAAGIKLHNAVDTLIRRNIFTKTIRADHIWLDVGNENNRITQNLLLDGIEQREAIFIECSRDGINMIDHNIIWNVEGRFNEKDVPGWTDSGAWYKNQEDGIINGYGIYGEGSDHIHMSHNLIGRCRSAGYYSKATPLRLMQYERGGTSRDARFYNNIFYDCKEAAIKMPTKHNTSEGNFFVTMPSGFLRILYPEPLECLNLAAWQEFYGFDKNGQEGFFVMEVDTEAFTILFKPDQWDIRYPILNSRVFVHTPEQIKEVECDKLVRNDFYGEPIDGNMRLPGPFTEITFGKVYSIDPRKKR